MRQVFGVVVKLWARIGNHARIGEDRRLLGKNLNWKFEVDDLFFVDNLAAHNCQQHRRELAEIKGDVFLIVPARTDRHFNLGAVALDGVPYHSAQRQSQTLLLANREQPMRQDGGQVADLGKVIDIALLECGWDLTGGCFHHRPISARNWPTF
jgi:hypothetical protein